MSTLPPIKRITREDVRDAPEWIENLLYPLNQFMDSVYSALNKLLTFPDNFLCQQQFFTVVAGAAATNNTANFVLTMKKRPSHMIVLSASVHNASDITTGGANAIKWNYDGIKVNITSISGLTNGTTYDITVLLI